MKSHVKRTFCNSFFDTIKHKSIEKMKKIALSICLLLFAVICSFSQVVIKTDAGDISMRLTGRTSFDVGAYTEDVGRGRNGVMLNDTRLGTMLSFDNKWNAHFELLLDNKSVSFRDITIAYSFDEHHSVKVGNYFMPFGAKITGLAYKFCEDAPADFAISPNRKMGAAYFYTSDKLNLTAGLFSDGNADAKALNQGWNLSGKVVYRPIIDDRTVLHLGLAPLYTQSSNAANFMGIVPATIDMVQVAGGLTPAENIFRLEGEVLFISGRLYAEARYQMAKVNLKDEMVMLYNANGDYVPQGTYDDELVVNGLYAQASFLLIGDQQKYHKAMAFSIAPAPKSLELLARVSHVDMAELGVLTDVTVGLTYHFNKYLNAKLNMVNARVKDGEEYWVAQGRLQFSF